jgi:very-short-patch-repair endonuclease
MEETPEISLGICSMNTKQRDLIEEEMDRERQRNPHVQAYIARWEGEGDGLESFFVKNLEAIQGDERDVMFISTLYGPESLGGKTHQRFGPINTAQGHRRLNVLFSRAKKKIVTFTSMDPTDILVDEGKSKGVQMLRNWLEYCKTGNLGEPLGANGGFESPFEEHVASVVEGLGYEVVPQVGTAGYRVDLGVRHPDWVHGFIAGIECDGATYHSSKSARDRDRLREEILTRLGWNLHRIWSTDWFTNPQMERDRIKTFLADRLATLKALPERKLVSSFNDILSRPVRPMAVQPPANTFVPRPEAVSPSKSKQADIFKHVTASPNSVGSAVAVDPGKRVRVGCSVTIMQNGEERSYKISASENDPHKGVLRKDVPLAEAMLDLEEGDEFEFALGVNVRNGRIIKIH